MTMEAKIRNTLLSRGMSNTEAATEAFNYVRAWEAGEVDPRTMAILIGEPTKKMNRRTPR